MEKQLTFSKLAVMLKCHPERETDHVCSTTDVERRDFFVKCVSTKMMKLLTCPLGNSTFRKWTNDCSLPKCFSRWWHSYLANVAHVKFRVWGGLITAYRTGYTQSISPMPSLLTRVRQATQHWSSGQESGPNSTLTVRNEKLPCVHRDFPQTLAACVTGWLPVLRQLENDWCNNKHVVV